MREDIYELASYVDEVGLNLAVTTNGTLVEDDPRLSLFRQVNFSIHGNLAQLKPKILMTKRHAPVGINFVVRRDSLGQLHEVAEFCRANDVELLLLSYKPVNGDEEEAVEPNVVMQLGKHLASTGVRIAMDGMTCGKCFAAQRFVDIGSTGDCFPCSFIRESLGSVLQEPFQDIWRRRGVPKECPYLRTMCSEGGGKL